VLIALIGTTWGTVKLATEHLLHEDARSAARHWANNLAENASDLKQIADGEMPSSTSMAFLNWAQQSGQVFRYEIFNSESFSQLIATPETIAPVDVSEFSREAAQAIATRQSIVLVREGDSPAWPPFYAKAYVPVIVDGETIAAVAAYVDQTEERDRFQDTFLKAAISLCLLTALAFIVPVGAWYRRTKEKERADEYIRYLAHHDAMTGLDNRFRLTEKLQRALIALPDRGGALGLHYVDLDRFKDVNDTLGHDAGDTLIQAAAERLRTVARKKDVVARVGGDEFTIVQVDVTDRAEAEALAQRVVTNFQQPFLIKGQNISVGASVGVAMAPADGIDIARLMQCADLALYKAKADGRNCARFFTPQLDLANQSRLSLEHALREAVRTDGFELYFQPVYESATKGLVGFEALIRLPPFNEQGMISPTVFIPIAEELGLIGYIGDWVLREACRAAATWPEHLSVSVNMSPAQFNNGDVYESVTQALKESGIAPHRLEIEITEGLLLGDTESVLEQLNALRRLGVCIVMDDFGTGYSSLHYLWRFHFDKIKIDQSFMSAYGSADSNAETIVKTIVALGRSLDMQVTVEGVETDKQARFVGELDADQVQGFYFGHPMPASEIAGTIAGNVKRDGATHEAGAAETSTPKKVGHAA
jgi:diguanylate cyclase (GGDEF)-like protein